MLEFGKVDPRTGLDLVVEAQRDPAPRIMRAESLGLEIARIKNRQDVGYAAAVVRFHLAQPADCQQGNRCRSHGAFFTASERAQKAEMLHRGGFMNYRSCGKVPVCIA